MTKRNSAPIGAPCWTDLSTTDVELSRQFYTELFGWQAQQPAAEFGGYFMFARDGTPVAGAMGGTEDSPATNAWKPYLAVEDVDRRLQLGLDHGARVRTPGVSVGNLGKQAVIADPSGAEIGLWQAGTFAGFTTINEPGAVMFVAIDVNDYPTQVAFYRHVFDWNPIEEEVDNHHYAGFMDVESGRPLAGIGDEVENLEDGEASAWSVFFQCVDLDAAVASVGDLGGTVIKEPRDGGLGRNARVADPTGARFWLCQARK